MKIDPISLELFVVDLPMTKSFVTSVVTVNSRRLVMVKLTDRDGVIGWGEAATTDQPVYKPDFPEAVLAVLEHSIWPALTRHGVFSFPEEVDDYLCFIRGHYFAKAAISMAVYDIAAQKANMTLATYIGAERKTILLSRTLSVTKDVGAMLAVAKEMVDEGYRDLKLKIAPGADLENAKALRKEYSYLPLMVDANAAYRLSTETLSLFHQLDELGYFCVEQPLDWNDLIDHARLQAELKTPIALDESIDCLHDFEQALILKSCRMLNIKIPRVGGLTEARRIYELGLQNKIGLWVGGMIEGPVGLAAVMAFSALEGMGLPADYIDPHFLISDYLKYFDKQPYVLSKGQVEPQFTQPGLGLAINFDKLCCKKAFYKKLHN